jgi:hypothetical protein
MNAHLKFLSVCGILAPIVYVMALVIGNILDPTYSQIGKTVSELIQRGAPNRDLLNAIFVIYNLLLIPFAVGMYYGLRTRATTTLISVALIVNSLLGVVWTLFLPLDVGGASTSLTGMLHLVVGALVVPLIFAVELSFWRSAVKDERWNGYGRFSLGIFVLTLVFGFLTVAFVNSDYRGLFERITTGSFLLWVEVLAIKLYSISKKS